MSAASASLIRVGALVGAIALVSAGAIVGISSPAQAHNYLVSSTPSEGEVLTELPPQFQITTNDALLSNGTFALQVTDAAGLYYGDGCGVIEGPSLSMAAALGEPGAYTLTWEAVSADAHIISGQIPFSWQPAQAVDPSVGSTTPPVCGQSAEPAPEENSPAPSAPGDHVSGSTEDPAGAGGDGTELLWLLGAGGAVAAAVVVTIVAIRRRPKA